MTNRKIYNLGPDRIDTCDNKEDCEYKVFEKILDAAFKNPDIRNIAVTGNFGIGKSRFLRYYGGKRKFLFVSGCSFMETDRSDCKDELNQVEYNLIYQLLLGCRRYVGSGILHGMPLIQLYILRILGSITGLLLLCTVFLLTLAPKLGPYLKELGWYNSTFNSAVHIAVYVGLFIVVGLDTFVLLWPGRSRHILNLKSLSLGLGSAKLSIENQDGTSFFYQNRHTLLSSLVGAANEIDRTVVFEDMDRLERADCLSLFTKLRELNQEVNLYIRKGEPIRFVYVLHDQLFSPGDTESSVAFIAPDAHIQLKFFDFVLPIIPRMSKDNAIIAAESLLEEDGDLDEILIELSPYLSDYRLLRNIANEYHVFSEVKKARREVLSKKEKNSIISTLCILSGLKKQDNEKEYEPTKDEKVKLLGFVIYKNLMPQDYKKIRESSSEVLPTVLEMDNLPSSPPR